MMLLKRFCSCCDAEYHCCIIDTDGTSTCYDAGDIVDGDEVDSDWCDAQCAVQWHNEVSWGETGWGNGSCQTDPCPTGDELDEFLRNRSLGACCHPDQITGEPTCSRATEVGCDLLGGDHHGPCTVCQDNPWISTYTLDDDQIIECPGTESTGACCVGLYGCVDGVTEDHCDDLGGTWEEGQTCSEQPCWGGTNGACCTPDEECHEVNSTICSSLGGSFSGAGTTCAETSCEHLGSCCVPDDNPTVSDDCYEDVTRDTCHDSYGGRFYYGGTCDSSSKCTVVQQSTGCEVFTSYNSAGSTTNKSRVPITSATALCGEDTETSCDVDEWPSSIVIQFWEHAGFALHNPMGYGDSIHATDLPACYDAGWYIPYEETLGQRPIHWSPLLADVTDPDYWMSSNRQGPTFVMEVRREVRLYQVEGDTSECKAEYQGTYTRDWDVVQCHDAAIGRVGAYPGGCKNYAAGPDALEVTVEGVLSYDLFLAKPNSSNTGKWVFPDEPLGRWTDGTLKLATGTDPSSLAPTHPSWKHYRHSRLTVTIDPWKDRDGNVTHPEWLRWDTEYISWGTVRSDAFEVQDRRRACSCFTRDTLDPDNVELIGPVYNEVSGEFHHNTSPTPAYSDAGWWGWVDSLDWHTGHKVTWSGSGIDWTVTPPKFSPGHRRSYANLWSGGHKDDSWVSAWCSQECAHSCHDGPWECRDRGEGDGSQNCACAEGMHPGWSCDDACWGPCCDGEPTHLQRKVLYHYKRDCASCSSLWDGDEYNITFSDVSSDTGGLVWLFLGTTDGDACGDFREYIWPTSGSCPPGPWGSSHASHATYGCVGSQLLYEHLGIMRSTTAIGGHGTLPNIKHVIY
jgi:hypothetical protein